MAQYVESADFIEEYGEQKFIRLFSFKSAPSDPEPTAEDAKEKFDAVAVAVSKQIDGYLRRKHTLPLATVPEDLKAVCLEMVHYKGQLKSPSGVVTDPIRNSYRDCVRWLEQLAEGKVDLGIEPQPTENSDRGPEVDSNERVLTQSRLRGVI